MVEERTKDLESAISNAQAAGGCQQVISSLQKELKEKLLSVFIPTAPNPTTGWYTLVPESSVKDLEISVEDAFKTIISAGIVNPDNKNNTTNPTFSKLFSQLRASTNTSS